MHTSSHTRRRLRASGAALALTLAVLVTIPAHAGSKPRSDVLQPDRLLVVSTVDVKGKTSPCGCHVPKGGFARREAFMDSLATLYGQTLLVDGGGWAADGDSLQRDATTFVAAEMSIAGVAAAGTSERELAAGLGYLQSLVRNTKLPLVCANLRERSSGKLVFPAYRIVRAGDLDVGLFALVSDKVALGPSADSLRVDEPAAAARTAIAEMRGKGAKVIVLLSSLGKVESEDLVTAVDGIDLVVAGHNVPVLQTGRVIKRTLAVYGGEQGHYVGVSTLTLGPDQRVLSGEAVTVTLSPDIAEKPSTVARVKAFEDAFAERKQRWVRAHPGSTSASDAAR